MRQPVPFGKYLLLDRISVGGMAEVFKAKSYGVEGFEKIIAIKRILPTMGEDRDFIKMFIDEAKIAGQLAHANICQIFELGRIDGSHFIAMEYIWGKDLLQIQNRLRKIKQPMPIPMACFTIAKVLEGLDYAHRKRDPLGRPLEIVHRDCSPQNVLVSYEGEVKVIDFGIAKATSRNSRTMAGVLKGKFGYMSPEQVRGLPLDRRSDLFALGTMLYECLTGDRLFQGETDFSTLEKVRNVDIRPPREINPNIPQAVEAVILKALAKDVDERYQWCSEMLADLQAFLMSQDVVFTAKSLSSWLKEVFATEIDRERQQLEQYKRVGRDGLIAGVPAAEAKVDVVETLGEAPPVEGDPTILGGPNFDDLEAAQAAQAAPAEVGPAPGSPAARGSSSAERDEDGSDFGEEAPTEIFGEIDHGANPNAPPAAGSQPRPPSATPQPATRPPKPPPHRAPTAREPMPASGMPPTTNGAPPMPPMVAGSPGSAGNAPSGAGPLPAFSPPAYAASAPGPAAAPVGQQVAPAGSQPIALGTPGSMAVPPMQPGPRMQSGLPGMPGMPGVPGSNGEPSPAESSGGYNRTLLGAVPPGLSNYAPPNYPPQPQHLGPPLASQPLPVAGQPQYPPPYGGNFGGPPMQPQQYLGPAYPQVPAGLYPPGQYGAPATPFNVPVPPIEPGVPAEGKRRSSIVRDVAIGVGIAALVLSGFLAVKYLVLDGDSAEAPAAASSYPRLRLAISGGSAAELFVDERKVATVSDKQEIPVTAGQHKIKLIGPGGAGCEQEMKLEPGKTKTLECTLNTAPAPGAPGAAGATGATKPGGANDGSATAPAGTTPGSAAPAGSNAPAAPASAPGGGASTASGSAAVPAGSGGPAGSAVAMAAETRTPSASPGDHSADKPGGHATDDNKAARPADKPAEHATASAASKPPEHPAGKPAKPAVEDDPLGRLDGGTKPGDKKPDDPTRSGARAAAADPRGYAAITSNPSAKIAIDGKDTGLSTPISGHALPLTPGKHKVTFVIGGDKFSFSIAIKAGETTPLHKDLQ
ncbi:MAG TPA: protein kinase [Kofleriaceae bacterium]|nr:protein kinase [Kofleriaceae bacterium]